MTDIYDPTTDAGTAVPGHDELVARAVALRELLWNDADASDHDRRLTAQSIDSVTAAGLTRLMTPRRFGGYQSDMRTFLDVATELGRGNCSAGWVAGVLNAGNFVASVFPAAARREVWGENPDARTALVLGAPRATVEQDGEGIRVSGEWPYASGSLHAEWVSVLIPRGVDPAVPGVHLVLIPAEDVEIKDTWHFAGMRATGSNTIVADHAYIPRHRAVPFMNLLSGDADQLVDATHRYRDSLMGLFSIGLLGAMIGGAEAAFQFVRESGPKRPVAATTYASQTASPSFQLDLAQAGTMIDAAKLLAYRIADTVDDYARAGEFPDLEIRARARMDSTHVAHQCREAIDLLLTAYGSSAFAETNPLQRIWRDVSVASRHAGFGMGVPAQLYGRALVGGDPREISFLV